MGKIEKQKQKKSNNSKRKRDFKRKLKKKPYVAHTIFTNILTMENKKTENLTECPKNKNAGTYTPQKIKLNTDSKRKRRRKRSRQNQNVYSGQMSDKVISTIVPVVKNIKESQNSSKKAIEIKQDEANIQNKKIKKIKKNISAKKDGQQIKSKQALTPNNNKIKVKRLQEMLIKKTHTKQTVRKIEKKQPLALRDRMMMQLNASRFRFINETLYSSDSSQCKQYFIEDPDAFKAYHDGYKQQVKQWPVNPLEVIILSIKNMPTDNIIADFGCGEAQLAASVPHKVHSFDFIALNDRVKTCDMTHTPLLIGSVHVVVFCLSLMGTNLKDYLREANRVLKINGILKIAEVESRFQDVETFIKLLEHYGFKNTWKDLSHDLFYFMDFKKEADTFTKTKSLPEITLKSCLYKKR